MLDKLKEIRAGLALLFDAIEEPRPDEDGPLSDYRVLERAYNDVIGLILTYIPHEMDVELHALHILHGPYNDQSVIDSARRVIARNQSFRDENGIPTPKILRYEDLYSCKV